jgi:hypothetical protein
LKNACRRRFVPRAVQLESRLLLTNNFQEPTWLGQTANMDLAGPGVAVGPGSYVNDEIQLTTTDAIQSVPSVTITLNPNTTPSWASFPDQGGYTNAEVVDVSGSSGKTYDVFFNPFASSGVTLTGGTGQTLAITVTYNDPSGGHTDTFGGSSSVPVTSSNPSLLATLTAPTSVTWNSFTAAWGHQDPAPTGLVHISVSGLSHTIVGAVLSDQVANNQDPSYWVYGTLTSQGVPSGSLTVTQNGATADVAFPPLDSEAGATMTLRLDFGSYGQQAAQVLGQTCDPGLTVPNIAAGTKTETPGSANIQNDANNPAYGTIYLSAGTYTLSQQLILNQPITIEPVSGATATIIFTQPQTNNAPPTFWPDAIEIKASHVTLENFGVQFSGPFLWTTTGGSGTGVINTYVDVNNNPRIDVTISGMIIQGPAQSPYDLATDDTNPNESALTRNAVFIDPFTSGWPDPKLTSVGGAWTEVGGVLSQTSNSSGGSQVKKVLVNSTTAYPGTEMIEAQVQLDSISGDGRAGVSLNNVSGGSGYNLVFHDWNGQLAVQILNDGRTWSQYPAPPTKDANGLSWQFSQYYTFQFIVYPLGGGVDALFGKVWRTVDSEPSGWTVQEVQSSGLSRNPGLPGLDGGSTGNGGYATADFKPVSDTHQGTTGNLVWAMTPSLFSHVDSTRWQAQQGTWTQPSLGALNQSSTSSSTNKRVLFPMAGTAPSSMMITAEVTPTMSLTDGSTVGVGLNTDSSGNGYELAFVGVGGAPEVELLNNGVVISPPTNLDGNGHTILANTAYGMQLVVLHQVDGTDTLLAQVWKWGPVGFGSVALWWNMYIGGQTHAAGLPSVDGGSNGAATAQFGYIYVTTATTRALPLLNMLNAYTGFITGNTLTGGTMFFKYGSWQITGNTYNGAVAETYVDAAFTLYTGHGRNLSGNTVNQVSAYGKTVRLLDAGNNETWASNDVISGNTVIDSPGIGVYSSSTWGGEWGWDQNSQGYGTTNQPEFILFESYYFAYEGAFYSVSSDGRELKIPYAQGEQPSPGDVVSILSGPNAGQWFQIAQVMSASTSLFDPSYTLLMDSPLPLAPGSTYAISIDEGFVNETNGGTGSGQSNTIDIRGSASTMLGLGAEQFGTRILNNVFLGNTFGVTVSSEENASGQYSPFTDPNYAYEPTSLPFGWTHVSVMGMQVDGNTFADLGSTPALFSPASPVASINVQQTNPQASYHPTSGRQYLSGQVENNLFLYSNPPTTGNVTAVQLGALQSGGPAPDQYELSLSVYNNTEVVPTAFSSLGLYADLEFVTGTIDGQNITSPEYLYLN